MENIIDKNVILAIMTIAATFLAAFWQIRATRKIAAGIVSTQSNAKRKALKALISWFLKGFGIYLLQVLKYSKFEAFALISQIAVIYIFGSYYWSKPITGGSTIILILGFFLSASFIRRFMMGFAISLAKTEQEVKKFFADPLNLASLFD